MNDKKNNLKEKVEHFTDEYGRKAMRYYFQEIAPTVGKYSGKITSAPQNHWSRLIPENLALWLIIATVATMVAMLLAPEKYWMVQPLIFIATFLFGHLLYQLLRHAFYTVRNLLVAYPGKHLLGQYINLKSPLVDGEGEEKLYGETWKIVGEDCEDCEAGSRVKVVAVENGNLFVEVEHEHKE